MVKMAERVEEKSNEEEVGYYDGYSVKSQSKEKKFQNGCKAEVAEI